MTIDEDIDDLVLELSINIDGERISNYKNILAVLDNPFGFMQMIKYFK